MCRLLVGVCILALVPLSAPLTPAPLTQAPLTQAPLPRAFHITQKPRFYGVKATRSLFIYCVCQLEPPLQVDWYRAPESGAKRWRLSPTPNVVISSKTGRASANLHLKNVRPEDSGVYYCEVNGTMGPGTGLQVMQAFDVHSVEWRSKMKDTLILLHALMLVSCMAALLFRKHTLVKKEEAIYADCQQDHIYEGLVVETCEDAHFEDILACTTPSNAAVQW